VSPNELVNHLRVAVIDDNTAIYQQLFRNTVATGASDPYWKRALTLFHELSPEQQLVLFEVVRQVAADTTSNVLGVLDGANPLQGQKGDFELSYEGGPKLNGDLQTLFLIEEERLSQG
jgi:predicted transcriptional regulator with HTH domain